MEAKALSVSELTRAIRASIEGQFGEVWVEGQVSSYRGPHSSGHRYFTLKDEGAQLKAVMFRHSASRGLGFELEEGQQVLAWGKISVYEPRGEYQIVIERMEPKGVGALQLAFEQLKKKLQAEGLFDPARKRPLPRYPRRVVLITSPTGAVIRDILHVTARRCPWVDFTVLPVRVQGEGAKEEISAALRYASRHLKDSADLVVLARGGGSLEDLWAFNEEMVARAIVDCALPVLSAVGHEVDYTIADFVADKRAPTPSAAAEILSPSLEDLAAKIHDYKVRAELSLRRSLEDAEQALDRAGERLARCHPNARLEAHARRLTELAQRAAGAARALLELKRETLAGRAGRLHALSPLAILARGYAACFDEQGRLVRAASDLKQGSSIEVRLGKGSLGALVRELRG